MAVGAVGEVGGFVDYLRSRQCFLTSQTILAIRGTHTFISMVIRVKLTVGIQLFLSYIGFYKEDRPGSPMFIKN